MTAVALGRALLVSPQPLAPHRASICRRSPGIEEGEHGRDTAGLLE
jgi:hypothetical protein